MNELREQVARARRRLVIEQFLARSVWCLFVALVVAAIAIALPRIIALSGLPQQWDIAWLVGAVVAAFVAAGVWTIVSRRSALDAAEEIDRRFELRERVASSLSLTEADLQSEAGQALLKDAVRAASRIDIGDKFRLRFSSRAWLPLVPAAIAFALAMFIAPREATSSIDPHAAAHFQEQKKTAMESARKKLEEQRKKAERDGLKSAEGLFKQIEEGTKELGEKKDLNQTKAAVKLNDLAKQLQQRQQQLGGKDGLSKQMQNLKNLGAGPAEKLAQAMKQGDMKKALEEIEKLAKDLREGKLDAQGKQDLAKQLEQMKENRAAEATRQPGQGRRVATEARPDAAASSADEQAAATRQSNGPDAARPRTRRRPESRRRARANGQADGTDAARNERARNARRRDAAARNGQRRDGLPTVRRARLRGLPRRAGGQQHERQTRHGHGPRSRIRPAPG
jgi:hypothetical protein